MLCFFKEVNVFVDIVFEEYPRIIRNRVNPGMGVRMLGELVLEKLSEERCSVESRGEVECYWFFRGRLREIFGMRILLCFRLLKKCWRMKISLRKK